MLTKSTDAEKLKRPNAMYVHKSCALALRNTQIPMLEAPLPADAAVQGRRIAFSTRNAVTER